MHLCAFSPVNEDFPTDRVKKGSQREGWVLCVWVGFFATVAQPPILMPVCGSLGTRISPGSALLSNFGQWSEA